MMLVHALPVTSAHNKIVIATEVASRDYEIRLTRGPFNTHIPGYHTGRVLELSYIGNRRIWGVNRDIPRSVLTGISVQIDGRLFVFPKALYDDCGEPIFNQSTTFTIPVLYWIDPDRRTVQFEVTGSDGGCGYSAWWKVSPDGTVTREIYGEEFMRQRIRMHVRAVKINP